MDYSTIMKKSKDIDEKKGVVSFYFSDFNSVDIKGDRVDKKAFNRTLKNNSDQVLHLLNHNIYNIIGKPIEIGVDEKGAFMVSQMSQTQLGKDTLILYKEGVYNQHSFGFDIIKSHKDGNVRVLTELKLYEASTVPFGANPNTPTISVKEIDRLLKSNELSENILEKLELLIKALEPVKDTSTRKQDFNLYDEFIEALKHHKK